MYSFKNCKPHRLFLKSDGFELNRHFFPISLSCNISKYTYPSFLYFILPYSSHRSEHKTSINIYQDWALCVLLKSNLQDAGVQLQVCTLIRRESSNGEFESTSKLGGRNSPDQRKLILFYDMLKM